MGTAAGMAPAPLGNVEAEGSRCADSGHRQRERRNRQDDHGGDPGPRLGHAGQRILLVDSDTQGQAGRALGLRPLAGLAEVIAGRLAAAQALTQARPGLQLLAGGEGLALAKREISRRDVGSEWVIAEALEPLAGAFDWAIVDTGPGWDVLTVNAIFACNAVLAPVSLELLALMGLADFARGLEKVQRYHQAPLRWVLPTFADRRRRQTGELLEQLRAHYGDRVCA